MRDGESLDRQVAIAQCLDPYLREALGIDKGVTISFWNMALTTTGGLVGEDEYNFTVKFSLERNEKRGLRN